MSNKYRPRRWREKRRKGRVEIAPILISCKNVGVLNNHLVFMPEEEATQPKATVGEFRITSPEGTSP